MNDTDLFILLIGILEQGMTDMGIDNVEIAQNYQPTQQGIVEGRALYIHKLHSNRYGYPGKRNVFNEGDGQFDTSEVFIRRPTFQLMARAIQDPADPAPVTAGDIANAAADIMQLESTRTLLKAQGVGIERITDVRNVYEENDKDRFEHTPTFDFTLNYEKIITSTVRSVDSARLNINRV